MPSSKEMHPLNTAFFPRIFFKNQFNSSPTWPSSDTDLAGKVALVTGANTGLGLETSKQLLSLGLSRLIMGVRSVDKAETVAAILRASHPTASIDVFRVDMASYDSIRAFVAQMEKIERLDIAILNAGVRKMRFELVPSTGHEETIQINYISTALLSILLLPVLQRDKPTSPGRLTIVGSGLALATKDRDWEKVPILPSLDDSNGFDALDRYNVSKLLGMMFLHELVEHVSAEQVVVNLVDPGFVGGTDLSRDLSPLQSSFMRVWKKVAARSVQIGASTYIDAAVLQGRGSHGCYLMSWKPSPFADMMYTPKGQAAIKKLWQETLAELSFADVKGVLAGLERSALER